MAPGLKNNQLIVAHKYFCKNKLKISDIIIIDHPIYGDIIKRIKEVRIEGFIVKGDGVATTSSLDIGLVKIEQVKYKILLFYFAKFSFIYK